jgi:hypothetical protein
VDLDLDPTGLALGQPLHERGHTAVRLVTRDSARLQVEGDLYSTGEAQQGQFIKRADALADPRPI